jgi:hypothetical protein
MRYKAETPNRAKAILITAAKYPPLKASLKESL